MGVRERVSSTNPDLVKFPEVDEVELSKWFYMFMLGLNIEPIILENNNDITRIVVQAHEEIKNRTIKRANTKFLEEIQIRIKLERKNNVLRMHQKLKLDAATIADVLDLKVKRVKKILAKK